MSRWLWAAGSFPTRLCAAVIRNHDGTSHRVCRQALFVVYDGRGARYRCVNSDCGSYSEGLARRVNR